MPMAQRLFRFAMLMTVATALSATSSAQLSATSQLPGPDDGKRYKLSGTVVNSVTGEPIRRALVSLFYAEQLSTMTDQDGHFEFEGLQRSRPVVTAQKPGYFSEQELSRGRAQATQVEVGPDAQSAIIKLLPEAVITGRIVDPDGLPIPRLVVQAISQKVVNGRKEWQQLMAASTDEDGRYRIYNLMPGPYFLMAGPGHAPAIVATGTDDSLDLGYPAVTYPAISGDAPAVPLKIAPGQLVQADIRVRPEPFYSVTGSVSGTTANGHFSVQLMSRMAARRQVLAGANPDPESGTFLLPRVPRGDYNLVLRGADENGNQVYGSMPIDVRSNVIGLQLSAEPMLNIPVRVRTERTREAPNVYVGRMNNIPGVQIRLMPVDPDRPEAFSGPENPKDRNSPLALRNAVPGRYRVELMPTFGDTYAASARLGTIDLLGGELLLTSSANQGVIEIVMRDDAPTLSVKVQTANAPGRVSVLVIPEHGQPILSDAFAGADNQSTQFRSLRPGSYTILAFDDLGDLEYMNPDALEPYLSHGTKVNLSVNQETNATVDLIKRGAD
jgi:hypothetical protein